MRLLEVGRRGPHVQLHDLLARQLLEPLTAAAAPPPPRDTAAQEGADETPPAAAAVAAACGGAGRGSVAAAAAAAARRGGGGGGEGACPPPHPGRCRRVTTPSWRPKSAWKRGGLGVGSRAGQRPGADDPGSAENAMEKRANYELRK